MENVLVSPHQSQSTHAEVCAFRFIITAIIAFIHTNIWLLSEQLSSPLPYVFWPRARFRVVRIDPLRFLAGCRKRCLNQA